MFDHTCTECERRLVIFPSQVTSLANTDPAIIVAFTCWCGAEQTMATGRVLPGASPPDPAVLVQHRRPGRHLTAGAFGISGRR